MKSIRWMLLGALAAAVGLQAQAPQRGGGPPDDGRNFRYLGAGPGFSGPVVKSAPYSADAVTEITQHLQDGSRLHQTSTSHVYRDSEGRTRREQALGGLGGLVPGGGIPAQLVFIDDPVAQVSYAINPQDRSASRMAMPSRDGGTRGMRGPGPGPDFRANGRPGPNGQNTKRESLGRQTIEGVAADGMRTTMTIPAGAIGNEQPVAVVTETWYSPDLHATVLSKHSDPRNGETVYRLTNIIRNEPPQTLFQVPADFTTKDAGGHAGDRGGPHGPRPVVRDPQK